MFYEHVIRPLLFQVDPEKIHDLMMTLLQTAQVDPVYDIIHQACSFEDPALAVDAFGVHFKNPIGIAAGFDKDCAVPDFLSAIGFGHIELGTVTPRPQLGNPKPRIVRFPEAKALVNRMGFPSKGVEHFLASLVSFRNRERGSRVGVNIGKMKETDLERACDDYKECYLKVREHADFVVLNVSSPNTPELRKLQEPDRLRRLYKEISEADANARPLLIKLAPDIPDDDLAGVLEVCLSSNVAGVIATNTTLSRDTLPAAAAETGGLSGKPLRELSLGFVRKIYSKVGERLPIIGVGGISSAEDVLSMVRAGATMVQIYTGFVYQGPMIVKRIKKELSALLADKRVHSLAELRGNP